MKEEINQFHGKVQKWQRHLRIKKKKKNWLNFVLKRFQIFKLGNSFCFALNTISNYPILFCGGNSFQMFISMWASLQPSFICCSKDAHLAYQKYRGCQKWESRFCSWRNPITSLCKKHVHILRLIYYYSNSTLSNTSRVCETWQDQNHILYIHCDTIHSQHTSSGKQKVLLCFEQFFILSLLIEHHQMAREMHLLFRAIKLSLITG